MRLRSVYSIFVPFPAGQELCLGRVVDPQILRMVQLEVAQLEESYKKLNDDSQNRVCFKLVK